MQTDQQTKTKRQAFRLTDNQTDKQTDKPKYVLYQIGK